ncbi:MAG TPA: ABC transporter substrate-binding protein, partial [Acidimicrobiia bacterium]|nr:ABC transporter substrate-binding protein [Acidimicrobiia bacterium]
MTSWKKLAAILTILAMVVAACGDGDEGGADTTAGGGTDTTADGGTDTTAAGEDPGTTMAEGEGEPIIAATSLPLTGEFSIPAELHRDGYQLCVDLINERGGVLGRELVLEVEDNQSDQEIAVAQYERMVAEADILFG